VTYKSKPSRFGEPSSKPLLFWQIFFKHKKFLFWKKIALKKTLHGTSESGKITKKEV